MSPDGDGLLLARVEVGRLERAVVRVASTVPTADRQSLRGVVYFGRYGLSASGTGEPSEAVSTGVLLMDQSVTSSVDGSYAIVIVVPVGKPAPGKTFAM